MCTIHYTTDLIVLTLKHKTYLRVCCTSLSLTAWIPRLDTLTEPNASEEDDENQEEEFVVHNNSSALERRPSFHFPPSSRDHNAGPSYLHTPPSKNNLI